MNKFILLLLFALSFNVYSQNIEESIPQGKYNYNDSLKSLIVSFGEHDINKSYFLDSSCLKYVNVKTLSIWMELDNKSDVYIKDSILPEFKKLEFLEIIRKNNGDFYLPKDLSMCVGLRGILIDLGNGNNNFKDIPNEIIELPNLEFFDIVLSKGCGNKKLMSGLKRLISNSKSLKIININYKGKKFDELTEYATKYNVKVNPR
jgi:hypothetical protein